MSIFSDVSLLACRPERGRWQRRFWEHVIRDEEDYAAHVDYCHINPVKHGYIQRVSQWPHSTFHRYVERGLSAELGQLVGRRLDHGRTGLKPMRRNTRVRYCALRGLMAIKLAPR